MSRPRQQPYWAPGGSRAPAQGSHTTAGGLLVWAGSCPTNHTRGVRGAAFAGAGGESTLSSEETHCSSRSALTGGMQPLPVPLRGGAWTRSPQEHLRPQERAHRSPALWASAPQGTGSTKNLRRHSAASWRSDSPGLRGPWGQTATFFTKSHGCFQRAGRFKNKCTGCS